MTDWLEAPLTELAPITLELLNLREENILSATDNLMKDHALKIDVEDSPEGPSSPLFERAAEVSKTDSKCLTAKRA